MGLDTSHDCWHGPYSAFARFRDAVAVVAKEHYGYEPDYDAHPLRAYSGWWDFELTDGRRDPDHHGYVDPLDVFFIHSDCDGWIFPHDGRKLADRLDPLVGYLDDEDKGWPTDRALLRRFIAGLRLAAENWEIVEFG